MSGKTIFFAYEGRRKGSSSANVDSIEHAVKEYNRYQTEYVAKTWESITYTTHISHEVLDAIEDCEVFVCDLTNFNHNVLFELGYAIGRNKKILILLNPDVGDTTIKYRGFFLKDLTYSKFRNGKEIQSAMQNKLWSDGVLHKYVQTQSVLEKNSLDLLYIKSKLATQATLDLNDKINFLKQAHNFTLTVDDPVETPYQPEAWYFKNIYNSKCTIIHFWDKNNLNAADENAKNSFFAGLSCGFGNKVLLVAPSTFNAPLDYHEILFEYRLPDELVYMVDDWLSKNLIHKKLEEEVEIIEKHEEKLFKLSVGGEIAEYEKEGLLKYFFETSSYHSALSKEKTIIVGRKGVGKTAVYIKLLDELSKNKFNYIVNIKPEPNELLEDAQLSTIFDSTSSKKSFFISAWRITILSRLAQTVYEKINSQPEHTDIFREEKNLIKFVNENISFMDINVLSVLTKINSKKGDPAFNLRSPRILEELYSDYLPKLLIVLKDYFRTINFKYCKVVLIADNLDKAWETENNLDLQSEMIVSLLEVENKIKTELLDKENKPVQFKTIVFLRKDIFDYILRRVTEPDKLKLLESEINWESYPELLKKVVENRFRYSLSLEPDADPKPIWDEFFDIHGTKEPFDSIKSAVILRPRDVIYFMNQLFDSVINRGGEKVLDSDVKIAVKNYANFFIENLIAETKAEYPQINIILSELQKYSGDPFEFKIFSKILDIFKFDKIKKQELTKVLFDKGYLLGYDDLTGSSFRNLNILQNKLSEKRWLVFPKKAFLIINKKYYSP